MNRERTPWLQATQDLVRTASRKCFARVGLSHRVEGFFAFKPGGTASCLVPGASDGARDFFVLLNNS